MRTLTRTATSGTSLVLAAIAVAFLALVAVPAAHAAPATMDITVLKSANATNVSFGNTVVFSIIATNSNDNNADDVVILDQLPSGITFQGYQASQGTYTPANGQWAVGQIGKKATKTLTITGLVSYSVYGGITNVASFFSSSDIDTDPNNNNATATLFFVGLSTNDLGLGKIGSTNAVEVGSPISYTLWVTNFGPLVASNVQVKDLLPASLSFVSAAPGTYNPTTGVWNIGTLAVGSVTSLTITATLNGLGAGKVVTNTAAISNAQYPDGSPGNNSASVTFQAGRNNDPDLTIPPINLELIPAGSYIIPMDTNRQHFGSTVFNMKAYGLAAAILYTNTPVKWAIRAGKQKDEADFTASVRLVYSNGIPVAGTATTLSFYAGPFIIVNDFTNRARRVITNYANNVVVFELLADTMIDIRYTLRHKPQVGVFDDGGTQSIHTQILDESGIPTNRYEVLHAAQAGFLAGTSCYTFVSSPHYDGGTTASQQTTAVRTFLQSGGNFLAQCAAVRTYENSSNGQFHTTTGFFDQNDGAQPFVFHNADTPTIQFQGDLSAQGGSLHDWGINVGSEFRQNTYITIQNGLSVNGVDTNSFRSGMTKLLTNGLGTVVTYLGGHSYGTSLTDNEVINGRRIYMNAVFMPVDRPGECGVTFTVDIGVRKSDNPDPVVQGSNLTYSIIVSNSGPFNASGVVATDTPPAQVTYVSHLASSGTYNNVSGVWTIGNLNVGQFETLSLTVNVSSNFTGIMTNRVGVGSTQGDLEPTNNVWVEPTTVICEIEPPVITCPSNITIECTQSFDPTNTGFATATDNSGTNIVITYSNTVIAGECAQSMTIYRAWKATDPCGNSSTCTQVIDVVDSTAPQLSGVPANTTNECDNVSSPASVTATDNCSTNVIVNFTETTNAGSCAQSYTLVRVWTASDDCENSVSATQFVSVVDTHAPQLSGVPANTTNECDNISLASTNVTATDNCDTDVPVNFSETTNAGSCAQSYTLVRVWSASDDCGNSIADTQLVTVVDTTSPVLFGVPGNDTNQCDNITPASTNVTATDNCDTNVPVNFSETTNAGSCAQSYTLVRVWSATDDCGNGVAATQLVSVVDTTAPQLSGVPANATNQCDNVSTAAVVTATDNCDTNVPVNFTETTNAGACASSYTLVRVWSATDECGNGIAETQLVSVVDTTAPTIQCATNSLTLAGDENCEAELPELQATASDNCDTNVLVTQNPPAGTIITGASNTTVTLTATDDCGNTNTCQVIVTVVCPGDIHLQKTVYLGHDGGASCPGSETVSGTVGDAITYCFTVTNSGAVTLTNVAINDATIPFSTNIGTLAVGGSASVYFETTLAGNLTNVAVVSGEDPLSRPVGETNTAQTVELNSICGSVYNDADGDGVFDAEDITNGIAGVTVTLYSGTNVIGSTTTAGDGSYCFTNLPPGSYNVIETDPAGYLSTADTAPPNDNTIPVTLTSGSNSTGNNFLDVLAAAVGDFVWIDNGASIPTNAFNGLQDVGEPGLSGVRMGLLSTNGSTLYTTTTIVNGVYFFTNLYPGTYQVRVFPPIGYAVVTNKDAGANDNIDSDFNPLNMLTDFFTLLPGEFRTNVDAGLFSYVNFAPGATVGGRLDDEGRAVLSWSKDSMEGTTGWYIERRRDDGEWTRVSDFLPVVSTAASSQYSWHDETAKAGRSYTYRLLEVESRGDARSLGPYQVKYEVPQPGAQ